MAEDHPEFCPVHGDPDDPVMNGWPCPAAVEGDPPEAETCPHFVAMLLRGVGEVEAGNYFEYYTDDDGKRWSQEYRLHQKAGEPRPCWHADDDDDEEPVDG